MFNFLNNIFAKSANLIATIAISLGLVSAPSLPPSKIIQKPTETKVEIVKEFPKILETPLETPSVKEKSKPIIFKEEIKIPNIVQTPKVVPPQPSECIDNCTFNYEGWYWERHPSPPPLSLPPSLPQEVENKRSLPSEPSVVSVPKIISGNLKLSKTDCCGWQLVPTGEDFQINKIIFYVPEVYYLRLGERIGMGFSTNFDNKSDPEQGIASSITPCEQDQLEKICPKPRGFIAKFLKPGQGKAFVIKDGNTGMFGSSLYSVVLLEAVGISSKQGFIIQP